MYNFIGSTCIVFKHGVYRVHTLSQGKKDSFQTTSHRIGIGPDE